MKYFLRGIFFISLLMTLRIGNAQISKPKNSKFFISAGYGLAGSFFVRSYEETLPFPSAGYKAFFKKDFIGNSQDIAVGIHLKNNFDLKIGLNYQHFTRHIKTNDTLSGVQIILDHTIHHRAFMWLGSINKNYEKKNYLFSWGFGLYYLRPKQEEVEISPPKLFMNQERDYQNSRLEEGGAFVELAYEYKFQPKVNLGVKAQFYYTISTGSPESVTLFPYIKLNF